MSRAARRPGSVVCSDRYKRWKEPKVARILLSCILSFHVVSALAADLSCAAQATDKKLAGAAKTSFMNKCERDARTDCEIAAGEKKLAGAAKTSFTNKYVKDAVGE
jgi:psiF repeat